MVISELHRYAIRQLKESGTTETPALDATVLMKYLFDMDEIGLLLSGSEQAEISDEERLNVLLQRRINGEPIAYLCGEKEFFSMRFQVMPGVLIPRGDTECVVECAARLLTKNAPAILDIGTGSGCIAVSLAKQFPKARVLGIDISESALLCAKHNAAANDVSVTFQQLDIQSEEPDGFFDLIISNPPYIRTDVIGTLEKQVREYEPLSALDGGTDGLDFYKRLIPVTARHLNAGGILVFETGYDHWEAVSELIKQENTFTEPQKICDLAKRDRGVYTYKK